MTGKGKNSPAKGSHSLPAPSAEEKVQLVPSPKPIPNQNTVIAMDLKTKVALWIIKIVIWLYDLITIAVYFVVQQPWKRWKADRTIWARHLRTGDPYSPIVRVSHSEGGVNPVESINTMDELFRTAVLRFGAKMCLGRRKLLSEADEYLPGGKVFKKVRLSDEYEWMSYADAEQRVAVLSGAMEGGLGLVRGKPISILAETRLEWFLVAQAAFRLGVPVATLYATLGEEGMAHALAETEVTHIFTSQDLLPKLRKILDKTPNVTHIVYFENIRPADASGFEDRITMIPFSQLEEMGATCEAVSKPDPPEPNDLAVIMYTSGSTGIPKGVMLTHKNMTTTAASIKDCIPTLTPEDVYIGYLPLAHVFEISAECFFFAHGVRVGYSSPYTLTDKSTGIMTGCKGDATILKPTLMCAVPLMADRIRKGVVEATMKKGRFAQELFKFSLEYKMFWTRKGFNTPIMNRLLFGAIKGLVGGRVRLLACGGAPLSPDTHDFIRAALDCQMIQAYGMTETAGSATVMSVDDYSTGRVGATLSNCYIRLVDWSEGNYFPTDKPYPRGEMVVGGDCVTLGYFKNDALTEECFKEEDGIRWFYTGDIGELHPDGTFRIIDRKKDLVKLQYGEYISLGKVEAELKTCSLIDNICVIGSGLHDHLIALVVPNVEKLAVTIGKTSATLSELCQDPQAIAAVLQQMQAQGRKSGLQRTEIPRSIKLCAEEWNPESGLVTAAFKIRRKAINDFYNETIERMYSSTNGADAT